ncbi:transposase [Dyella sp.]|uniref:transposase n=1 Tax=Dyella sp. TaxID=1869338 RepID=UPI002ED32797
MRHRRGLEVLKPPICDCIADDIANELAPALRQSGKTQGRAGISKLGQPIVRAKLYMAAVVAKTHNPAISRFCQRLLDQGKPRLVAIVASMRKLLHIAWGVIRSGKPFDPNIALA